MNIDVRDVLRLARSDGVARIGEQIGDAIRPPASRPIVPKRVGRRTYGPERDRKAALIARTVWRVALSATGLLVALSLVYLYRAEPATLFDELRTGSSAWLSLGAMCVPLTFLAIHLANRRYGPAIAVGQVFTAWLAVAFVAIAYPLHPSLELAPGNPARIALALPVSLLLSHLVAIVAFDATRSVQWWKAPLSASIWASVVFALTFYPAAYLGSDGPWFSHLTEYVAVLLAVSFGSLAVYWVARPIVRPLAGLAGY